MNKQKNVTISIPVEDAEYCGLTPDGEITIHAGENVLMVTPKEMTVLQAALATRSLIEVACTLIGGIRKTCGECGERRCDDTCPYGPLEEPGRCPYWDAEPEVTLSDSARETLGIPKENVVIMSSGKVLELKEEGARFAGEVQAQGIMVDGLGVGDVGNIVLRDRQHLSENGLMVVVLTLEKGSNQVISGPDIVSRGFVYVREAENLMDECLEIVNIALDRIYDRGVTDWGRIKAEIKDSLNDFLWKKTKRNPMILPIIMEV